MIANTAITANLSDAAQRHRKVHLVGHAVDPLPRQAAEDDPGQQQRPGGEHAGQEEHRLVERVAEEPQSGQRQRGEDHDQAQRDAQDPAEQLRQRPAQPRPLENPRDSPPLGERVDPHALERAAREPPQERRHQEADDEQDQRAAQARKEAAQLFLGVIQQGDRESAHGVFRDPPSRLASP